MKWVALLPLRGGSKSLPDKNIRRIAGKPLFAWSLSAALESACFDEIYVSSDSARIRDQVSAAFPTGVRIIDRPPATATDTASSESVMLDLLARAEFDVLALIQATSPMTQAQDFVAARERFLRGDFDSLVSAVEFKRFLWSAAGEPLNYDPRDRPRRQDMTTRYLENGAFYFTRVDVLRETGCRLGKRVAVHEMAPQSALEIDEPADWETIEIFLQRDRRNRSNAFDLAKIDALVVDVDGTLTDAGMYYGASGETLKKFNTRDAKGLQLLRERGVLVCVMTAEDSAAVTARMSKLKIEHYHCAVEDKLALLKEQTREWGIPLSRIGFIGDDLGDLDCLRDVGVSFCPADAVDAVRSSVDYVCQRAGGHGAVREVCDRILSAKDAVAR